MNDEKLSLPASYSDYWSDIAEDFLALAGVKLNGCHDWDIQVKNPLFCKRVLRDGSLGLGESYMDGWWDCKRLDMLFHKLLLAGLDTRMPNTLFDAFYIAMAKLINKQSKKRAWTVGKQHYDLGDDLFANMLDSHMQYSCGYWAEANDLESAQTAKLELICRKLMLRPGLKLLDIGCGWGGLARYAAEHYGVSVVGVTISKAQHEFAQTYRAGLPVEIRLQDYRDLNENFDRIVSVGMFEHVGPKNYATYFHVIARCLNSDGLFLLHTIGANKSNMNVDPWIEKYIFPNGYIPSAAQITKQLDGLFVLEDWHNFGADYDTTLMAWYRRFVEAWPKLRQRYDERFYRMFTYYLQACAGAFRARNLQLWQLLLTPYGIEGGLRVAR